MRAEDEGQDEGQALGKAFLALILSPRPQPLAKEDSAGEAKTRIGEAKTRIGEAKHMASRGQCQESRSRGAARVSGEACTGGGVRLSTRINRFSRVRWRCAQEAAYACRLG